MCHDYFVVHEQNKCSLARLCLVQEISSGTDVVYSVAIIATSSSFMLLSLPMNHCIGLYGAAGIVLVPKSLGV